jgi:hypothetical protein
MHRYVVEKQITYRDDSILVNGYLRSHNNTYTVRSPEFFADTWRLRPTVFELEHYGAVKRNGNWLAEPGSSLAQYGAGKKGADFFRGALDLLHATYIGYHGYAHEWLADNPKLTVELLNRCGYWYFLHSLDIPDKWKSGTSQAITMKWENKGVAPGYNPYCLILRLQGPETIDIELDSGNRAWIPEPQPKIYSEDYQINIPEKLDAGEYELKLKLYCRERKQDVLLALDRRLLDDKNFYRIAKVIMTQSHHLQ